MLLNNKHNTMSLSCILFIFLRDILDIIDSYQYTKCFTCLTNLTLVTCRTCDNSVCTNCGFNCSSCKLKICKFHHSTQCYECKQIICEPCEYTCLIARCCGKKYCYKHANHAYKSMMPAGYDIPFKWKSSYV